MKNRGTCVLGVVFSIFALIGGCDRLPNLCDAGAPTGGHGGTGGAPATGGAGSGGSGTGGMASGGAGSGGRGIGGAASGGAGSGGAATGGAGGTTGGAGGPGGAVACTPGSFASETLTFLPAPGALSPDSLPTQLAARTDREGRIHLLFNTRGAVNQVLYASKPIGLGWSTAAAVASMGSCGGAPLDLVVGPTGIVDVLFTCGGASQSQYHDRRTPDGLWQYAPAFDVVYQAPQFSASTDSVGTIDIDAGGAPLVAYSNRDTSVAAGGQLVLAAKPAPTAAWQTTEVVATGAKRPFLVRDAASRLHVTFVAALTNVGISYAVREPAGTDWSFETVDAAGIATVAPLAVGADGVAHVLYGRADGVRHAVRGAGGTWTAEAVSATGTVGSFVVGDDGRLRGLILAAGQATYVQRAAVGGAWTTTPLGTALDVGARVLAVEPSGVVHAFFLKDASTKIHAYGCPAAP